MRRRKRLLFADDLAMTRTLLFRFLKEAMPDIEILEAPDGPQAVAIAEAEQPDVVLLDLRMTEMDGWEAARRIRALPGNDRLPIIATSVTASPEIEEQVRRAGFTEFIPKPVSDYSFLQTRLEHYLRGSSAAEVEASALLAQGEPASRRLH
jgi:CheY-like chemotaxis protein